MKKILLVALCAVLFNLDVMAQYKYKEIKHLYNHKDYVRQPGEMYDPSVAGIASLLIPGLGQMINREGGRGVGFLLGTIGLYSIGAIAYPETDDFGNITGEGSAAVTAVAVAGGMALSIISIVDAVRVAKVKNLAYRDKPLSRMSLHMDPHIGSLQTVEGVKANVGLKFSLKF